MKNRDKNKLINIVIGSLISIFIAIAFISIATICAMNMNFIYKIIINKFDLVGISGVSSEGLMFNYKSLIEYLQNPFVDKLQFRDFAMSTEGAIHFFEVKKIFMALIIISIIFVICIMVAFFITKIFDGFKGKNIISLLNNGCNILIGFFITISIIYVVDFSWAFKIFHKIFFRNNYWIFDPAKDPIIDVLPEELFMIYGAIILLIIVMAIIVVKIGTRVINKSDKK